MKQDKSYEEKIADIKKYLKEKEDEVARNKVSEVRSNPIHNNDQIIFDDLPKNEDKKIFLRL